MIIPTQLRILRAMSGKVPRALESLKAWAEFWSQFRLSPKATAISTIFSSEGDNRVLPESLNQGKHQLTDYKIR